jgi:hypothetical protein
MVVPAVFGGSAAFPFRPTPADHHVPEPKDVQKMPGLRLLGKLRPDKSHTPLPCPPARRCRICASRRRGSDEEG